MHIPAWPEQTTQGGAGILTILERMGAAWIREGDGITVTGTGGLKGAGVLDLHPASELTCVVAALAALATGETTITGVAHIRGHETDRLAALSDDLARVGAQVRETSDGLHIIGAGPQALHAATWATHADHRMAHAGALIGLAVDGIELDDVSCTTKTIADFPGLWNGMLAG